MDDDEAFSRWDVSKAYHLSYLLPLLTTLVGLA